MLLPQPLSHKEMMIGRLVDVRWPLCCRGTSSEWRISSRRIKSVSRAKNQTTLARETQFPVINWARIPAKPQSRSPPHTSSIITSPYSSRKQFQYEFHHQSVLMSSFKRITYVILSRVAFLRTRPWHLCLGPLWQLAGDCNKDLLRYGLQTGPRLLAVKGLCFLNVLSFEKLNSDREKSVGILLWHISAPMKVIHWSCITSIPLHPKGVAFMCG